MLGGGGAGTVGQAVAREVGHAAAVAHGKDALEHLAVATNAQVSAAHDAAARLKGQVAALEHGIGHGAGAPQDGCGVVAGTVGRDDMAVLGALDAGLEVNVSAASLQVSNRLARLRHGELGEDLLGSLDEVEVKLGGVQARVLLADLASKIEKLGKALHARETAAHGDERHETRALGRALGKLRGAREVRDEVVAQVDGLFGRLETHGVLGDAGNGKRARHGAQGDHKCVGLELEGVAVRVGKRHALLGSVDGGDAGTHDARLLQMHGKGRLDVAGLDGA